VVNKNNEKKSKIYNLTTIHKSKAQRQPSKMYVNIKKNRKKMKKKITHLVFIGKIFIKIKKALAC